jgi:hypothetical protein
MKQKMSLTTGNLVSEFLSSLFVPFLYIEKILNFSNVVKTFENQTKQMLHLGKITQLKLRLFECR